MSTICTFWHSGLSIKIYKGCKYCHFLYISRNAGAGDLIWSIITAAYQDLAVDYIYIYMWYLSFGVSADICLSAPITDGRVLMERRWTLVTCASVAITQTNAAALPEFEAEREHWWKEGKRWASRGGWGEQVHLHAKFICGMLNVGANSDDRKVDSEMCERHGLFHSF